MAVIAPPSAQKISGKQVKSDNSFLKDALSAKMREVIVCEDGRQMTVAQAGAERLTNIMLYAESNSDSVSAAKLIFERLYGKAAIEKKDETREMPKIIFALDDSGVEKMREALKEEPESDGFHAKFDSGEEFIG